MISSPHLRGLLRTLARLAGIAAIIAFAAGGANAAAPPAAPPAARAVPSDAVLRNFELSGDFILVVDGKEQPKAEIYQSEPARAFVVIASELVSPLLISAATQSVDTVDLMKVAKQPSGAIDLLADAVLQPAGRYKVDGPNIEFTYSGKTLRLVPRPYLLGKHTGAELLAHNPSYGRRARDYNPDIGIMKRLKAQKQPVRILTFFGSWCPHCSQHVPLLLKVEQGLAGSRIQFEYLGMPKGPAFGEVPEAKKYKIDGVPTAILFLADQEIGRIPNSQWSNPEVALDLQLNGPKGLK